ncbi:cathepsin B-like cysteine proteinase 3 isoform X2 [Adelges cooleyi]|uniref:cathepsin B-like cysteine proteinase 3 isoform X2 n=1 Tax=Adelges cooleyi TaxID=133065 RepID=UPI002180816D|nr:cathepsin B-like cysteine proteinase 3 isoform X2 [Adelges cooleyi]
MDGRLLSDSGERYNIEMNLFESQNKYINNFSLPKNFDARKKWTRCDSLGAVRYQSNCNSDWAIAVAGVFSDRLWINSRGKTAVTISFEHILTCAISDGCKGGEPDNAWNFLKNNGAVTGDDYRSNEGCQPYEIAPCSSNGYRKCNQTIADTPVCYRNCTNSHYRIRNFEADLHRTRGNFKTISPSSETEIMNEVYFNGSVAVAFDGYKDLFDHVTGIYVKKSDEFVRRLSVKIIGWGVRGNQFYWLMVNCWGKLWADHGLFKMERNTLNTLSGSITTGYA